MIEYDEEKIRFHFNNLNITWKKALKNFFNDSEVIELLNKNDFSRLYQKWFAEHYNTEPRALTLLLLLSGLDPLPYLEKIPVDCFFNISIKKVIIPSNIKTIETDAFSFCGYLEEIEFPKNVKIVSEDLLTGCGRLNKVVFNNSHSYIKEFYKKEIHEFLDIKNNVEIIYKE